MPRHFLFLGAIPVAIDELEMSFVREEDYSDLRKKNMSKLMESCFFFVVTIVILLDDGYKFWFKEFFALESRFSENNQQFEEMEFRIGKGKHF